MDRQISDTEVKKRHALNIAKYVVIFGIIAALIWFGRGLLTNKIDKEKLHIVTVERGDIQNTLTATGIVVPALEREINAPVATEIKRLYDELQLKRNNIDKLKLEYDKNLRDLDYQNQIKALQLEELDAQVTDQKRLQEVGGSTAEEVEQAELQLKVARLEKSMLENELDYRQSVNVNEKKGLELEYTIQENRLAELNRKLRETNVRAPQEGVITWVKEDLGRKVQEGEPLVRIANLEKFRVEASSSDRNTNKIAVGMPVKVRVNREDLPGHIATILPAVENNTVRFNVELDNPDNGLLRPNIRADVLIITDKKADVLKVKNGPAFRGAASQYIYVIRGDKAVKTRISKGLQNSDQVEIVNNLNVGDRIIISDMEDFDHLDEFIVTKN